MWVRMQCWAQKGDNWVSRREREWERCQVLTSWFIDEYAWMHFFLINEEITFKRKRGHSGACTKAKCWKQHDQACWKQDGKAPSVGSLSCISICGHKFSIFMINSFSLPHQPPDPDYPDTYIISHYSKIEIYLWFPGLYKLYMLKELPDMDGSRHFPPLKNWGRKTTPILLLHLALCPWPFPIQSLVAFTDGLSHELPVGQEMGIFLLEP